MVYDFTALELRIKALEDALGLPDKLKRAYRPMERADFAADCANDVGPVLVADTTTALRPGDVREEVTVQGHVTYIVTWTHLKTGVTAKSLPHPTEYAARRACAQLYELRRAEYEAVHG